MMKTIHHVLGIDTPTDKVWSALTERDQLARWWSTEVRSSSPALGAQIEFTFADDFNPVMEIAKLDKPDELVWRCVSGHGPWQDNDFHFELVMIERGRTWLRFWQHYATELSDDAYGTYNFNWGYYLESLRLLCATGTGKPYAARA
jgi:uncharacterized protein YndB with AHSA1/START domain